MKQSDLNLQPKSGSERKRAYHTFCASMQYCITYIFIIIYEQFIIVWS